MKLQNIPGGHASTVRVDALGTTASPVPDESMQRVLQVLSEQGGKPIETLSPADGRQQPTPADAVRLVMQAQGLSRA